MEESILACRTMPGNRGAGSSRNSAPSGAYLLWWLWEVVWCYRSTPGPVQRFWMDLGHSFKNLQEWSSCNTLVSLLIRMPDGSQFLRKLRRARSSPSTEEPWKASWAAASSCGTAKKIIVVALLDKYHTCLSQSHQGCRWPTHPHTHTHTHTHSSTAAAEEEPAESLGQHQQASYGMQFCLVSCPVYLLLVGHLSYAGCRAQTADLPMKLKLIAEICGNVGKCLIKWIASKSPSFLRKHSFLCL